MPIAHKSWTVLPHGPLEKLSPRVWRVEGQLPDMELRRVMTIVGRDDGDLVIHNAIALEEETQRAVEALGSPRYLIVPNGYHRLDAPSYKERYPDLAVYCPPGAVKAVEKAVPVTGTYGDFPADGAVRLETLEGVKEAEGVMIVHDDEGTTLVFNDIVFNMPHGKGLHGFVFRHITASTGGPRISRLARWLIVKEKRALRGHLERLAGLDDLKRIIVSHHQTIDEQPAEVLRAVAATL